MNDQLCPVPALAETAERAVDCHAEAKAPRVGGETRGSANRNQGDVVSGSRGGANNLDAVPRPRGRPRLPDRLLSPDAIRMRKVYASKRRRRAQLALGRKAILPRYENNHCGFVEIPESHARLIRAVDIAARYFWSRPDKPWRRKNAVPTDLGGHITAFRFGKGYRMEVAA